MKKIVLGSFLLGGLLSGFEISMSKEFVKEIQPNTLGINVSISAKGKSSKEVIDKLGFFSDFIKSFKDMDIKGGTFSTRPLYIYENNRKYKKGYTGRVTFQINSQDEEMLKNFITMITAKDSDDSVDLFISTGEWKVSQNDIKKEQDRLKFKALSWADEYSKILSEKTGKSCDIKSVDFQDRGYRPPIVYEARAVAAKDAPMPQKNIQKISVDARFKFECN